MNTIDSSLDPAEIKRRIQGIQDILKDSNDLIFDEFHRKGVRNATGFSPLQYMSWTFEHLLKLPFEPETKSLDMGCGNGGFALFAAAVGFDSYGIDASPYLIDHAEENLTLAVEQGFIDDSTICNFAVGNMYEGEYAQNYEHLADEKKGGWKNSLPQNIEGDAYQKLGIKPSDFGIIYAFPWEDQMDFLCVYLSKEARDDSILVVPHGMFKELNGQKFKDLGNTIYRKTKKD